MLLDLRMRLLTAHKILIAAALFLAVVLTLWGAVHASRGEPNAWIVLAVGVTGIPALGLYLRKLYRNPPLR